MRKHLILLLPVLAVCLLPAAAATETDWIHSFWSGEYCDEPVTAGEMGLPEDRPIPLFAAPFDEALPLEPIPAGGEFTFHGTLQARTWAWAETADARVGWIEIDPARCRRTLDDIYINRTLCRVTRETGASLTPGGPAALTLREGDTVIAMLADAAAGWVYFEAELDGKPAWLYGDPDALEPVSMTEAEGNTVRILEGVTTLGYTDRSVLEWVPDEDADGDDEEKNGHWQWFSRTLVRPGDIAEMGVDLGMIFGYSRPAAAIEFPKSLRILGDEAIVSGELTELRLPESLEYVSRYGSVYATDVRRMVIPAGCTADVPDGEYMTVFAYEVEAGNPRYKSVDGVLFSADGKTLLRYPNGRRDLHYDVPAGTEVIAANAFSDDLMNLPLKTLSLPIGLKRIEGYAFAGCGRLQSLTVPLTVTEIADSAFYACVSLERLSLPPGLSAEWNDSARQADFTWYNGDNGTTVQNGDRKISFWPYAARVTGPSGEETVPMWKDWRRIWPAQDAAVGSRVRVIGVRGDMAEVQPEKWYGAPEHRYRDFDSESCWISLDCLRADTAGSTLFRLTGAVLNATGERFDEDDVELDHGKAVVLVRGDSIPEGYGWDYREKTYTKDELTLLRDGDDRRTLAFLCSPDDSPIPFLDAPGGAGTGCAYDGEQAVVLEQRDGWALVRTLRQTGWVDEACLWVAEGETSLTLR